MGRYIRCKIGNESKIIYQYIAGRQKSEIYRINTELEIGEYQLMQLDYVQAEGLYRRKYTNKNEIVKENIWYDKDILILAKNDVYKLKEQVKLLKKHQKSMKYKYFIGMIEVIIEFMEFHTNIDKFVFEGDLEIY